MNSSKKITYLDHNATTPVDKRVIDEMYTHFAESYGNASSQHSFGNRSKATLDDARSIIAATIHSDSDEIYFTSGATESLNLALKGLALHPANTRKHIITCKTEHSAVLETCEHLETVGFEVTYLPVNRHGEIDLSLLERTIKDQTLLVCLMWVNNETGVIHPINEIGRIAREKNIYFICDGTQGIGKIPLDVKENKLDVLCFSGHKIYAPKGVGGIYVDHHLIKRLQPQIHGGGQERGLRSGTYNVPLAAGMGKAFQIAAEEMDQNAKRLTHLREFLEAELLKINGAFINGEKTERIYNTVNICIPGLESEVFIGMNRDIAVSNGSACSSALIQPSHVLLAMGLDHNNAMDSLRISMGKDTTVEELKILINRIHDFVDS